MQKTADDAAGADVAVLDASTDTPTKYPRAIGRQPIKTLNQLQDEMARVYKAVASGKISTSHGSKMIYMLREIAKTVDDTDKVRVAVEAYLSQRQQLGNR